LNVRGVNDVKQTQISTAEPLVPEPRAFEFGMSIEERKKHSSSAIDSIPAGLIKAGRRTIRTEIHKLINSVSNNEKLHEQCKESITVPIYKKDDKTGCIEHTGIQI
jgi:hypothetical protein